jgi:type I restriction enzyme S subunit
MDLRTFLENFDTIAEAPNGIPKLRSLILDLAVRGKLVPQNPEDEPATLLVKQTITLKQELLKAKKIRKTDILFPAQELIKESLLDGWVVSPLGILCFLLVDGSHNPPSKQEKGIPMLSGQNVRDGYITLDASRYITEEDYNQEISRTPIREGDVFLSIVGSIGRSAVVPREFPKCALQRSIALIRTNLYPQYLSLFLRSSVALQYYEEHGKGTAQKGIYLNKLSELEVIIPPLDEQKRIVAKVNELMELCDRLSSTQQTRDNLRQKLRKSAIDSLMNADDEASEKGRAIVRDNWQTFSQSPEDVGDLRRAVLDMATQGKHYFQNTKDEFH